MRAKYGCQLVWIAVIVLSLGALVQAVWLLRNAAMDLQRSLADAGQPAPWRGAKNGQGRRFAQYLRFLNESIPLQARVVLPPDAAGPKALASTPLMQFFLAPRTVINCPDAACARALSGPDTYFLVVGGFPGADLPESAAGLAPRMYDDEWGVLGPPVATVQHTPGWQGAGSLLEVAAAFLPPLAWLGLLALAGLWLVRGLLPAGTGLPPWALGYGLGTAALTALLAVASLLGLRLSRELVWAASAGWFIAGLAVFLSGRKKATHAPEIGWRRFLPDAWQVAFLSLGALAGLVGVGRGYHVTDEVILWGVKGYGIAATGSVAGVMDWGTNTVAYPLHIPLLIAAFRLLFGEALPASKLAFAGYYTTLLFLSYGWLLRQSTRRRLAGPAVLLLGTAPLVFRHATIAYANLPLGFYLLAGSVLLAEALNAGHERRSSGRLFLGGIFLAAAAWTRPEGWALAWLVAGLGVIFLLLPARRTSSLRQAAFSFLSLIAPLLGYRLLWAWLQAVAYNRPSGRSALMGDALGQILSGNLHLPEAVYVTGALLQTGFDWQTWGVWGMVLVVVALGSLLLGRWRRSQALLALVGLAFILAIAGMYYMTSYDVNHDISWWVNTGLERMLLPGALLLWAGVAARLELLDHRQDRPVTYDAE